MFSDPGHPLQDYSKQTVPFQTQRTRKKHGSCQKKKTKVSRNRKVGNEPCFFDFWARGQKQNVGFLSRKKLKLEKN
jgi:hypothetical protein